MTLNTAIDPMSPVIFWVTIIFFSGVLGSYVARQFHQPGVLGELLMGMLIGNVLYYFDIPMAVVLREGSALFSVLPVVFAGNSLSEAVNAAVPDPHYASLLLKILSGPNGVEFINIAYVLDVFSRYGVIFLLFMVGLESSVEEICHTGFESIRVAIIGVIAPIILGLLAARILLPNASVHTGLFVAATLSATSIGITARVLKELKKIRTREAKTILGAAMLDDVLGLILLAIVSGIVIHGQIKLWSLVEIIFSAIVFFVSALLLGPWIIRKTVSLFKFSLVWEAKLYTSFLFVMCLAWLATLAQLAAIIGAFLAGIIINEKYFEAHKRNHLNALSIHNLMAPLEAILAPIFFMLIGMQVKLETLFDWHVLILAAGLTIAAIVGKLLSGLGGSARDDRWLIGVGMLARGEVGLVFAAIGKNIGVLSDELYSAIIMMVIITTLITPLWLKARYKGAKHAS